ncbi:MAG TPA: glycosyltransferase 87 family protein [Acidimicrobiia bacterium]
MTALRTEPPAVVPARSPIIHDRRRAWMIAGATGITLVAALLLQLAFVGHHGHNSLSDLPRVFAHRRVGTGGLPYVDRMIEYPVVAGELLYLAATVWPTPTGVLVVTAAAASVVGVILALVLERRVGARAWRWAVGTPLLLYAFQNWDVFAIAALVAGLVAFERKRNGWSGVALGLGAAIKLFPAVAVPPLVAIRLARGDRRGAVRLAGAAIATFAALNLPFAVARPSGWWWPFAFQGRRNATWGSAWFYALRLVGAPVHGTAGAHLANAVSLVALTLAIAVLVLVTVRNRLSAWPAVAAAVALFILANKVYSPAYDLWLVVFFVMLPVSRRLWLGFCAVDLAMYLTVFGHFHGYDSPYLTHNLLPALVVIRTCLLVTFVLVAVRQRVTADPVARATTPAPTSRQQPAATMPELVSSRGRR